MTQAIWSFPTRLLHMAMALAVSLQLLLSLVMVPPDEEHASTIARLAYEAHQWVGLTAVVVVILHWLWSTISRQDGGLAHLFPWSDPARAAIKDDLVKLRNRQLPEGGPRGGLPGLGARARLSGRDRDGADGTDALYHFPGKRETRRYGGVCC